MSWPASWLADCFLPPHLAYPRVLGRRKIDLSRDDSSGASGKGRAALPPHDVEHLGIRPDKVGGLIPCLLMVPAYGERREAVLPDVAAATSTGRNFRSRLMRSSPFGNNGDAGRHPSCSANDWCRRDAINGERRQNPVRPTMVHSSRSGAVSAPALDSARRPRLPAKRLSAS